MSRYKFTPYFENKILRKRPYLKKEWCIRAIENPIKVEPQESNRFRFGGGELEGKMLRVITLEDKLTIFLGRNMAHFGLWNWRARYNNGANVTADDTALSPRPCPISSTVASQW